MKFQCVLSLALGNIFILYDDSERFENGDSA